MTHTCEDLLKCVDDLIDSCEFELRSYEHNPTHPVFKTVGAYLDILQENTQIELEHYKQMKELLLNENTTTK